MAANQRDDHDPANRDVWPSPPLANNYTNNELEPLDGIDSVPVGRRPADDNGAPLDADINGLLARQQLANRPLILITDNSNDSRRLEHKGSAIQEEEDTGSSIDGQLPGWHQVAAAADPSTSDEREEEEIEVKGQVDGQVGEEVVDGIRYRIVAAVTKPPTGRRPLLNQSEESKHESKRLKQSAGGGLIGSMRRKSSAFVTNLLQSSNNNELGANLQRPRRLSIYEMTKSPPPETSLEIYLNERRRSSTISAKQVQQQLEQQTTFEANYSQRQQYFKDLNQRLINHDKKLLNVVANRGQIHRHSVDIAQLPLHLASKRQQQAKPSISGQEEKSNKSLGAIDQSEDEEDGGQPVAGKETQVAVARHHTTRQRLLLPLATLNRPSLDDSKRDSLVSATSHSSRRKTKIIIRKFQKLDSSLLNSTPAPDVKIGQRVAYKEYYGNEFGTIRWIGRVPQICPDWTAGIEFDNAIGEGDGSLNGRRYFIAKDCFAKFLPLNSVALVDQHVGRPEPGTMISVMSAAVRPGQMISIQRVSTVHVQHCFLNAPHHRPTGAEILAVNSRLHCQCPNCGPCAHVIKPPRTQRLARSRKNATHMCQFSTYTCCGMESQEEALCTYTGNKVSSLPPPKTSSAYGLPPIGNSWMEGSGYLSQLQAQQSKLMPEEYRIGAAPEDIENASARRRLSRSSSSRRGSGKHHHQHQVHSLSPNPVHPQTAPGSPAPPDDDHLAGSQYSPVISSNGDLALACLDGKTLDEFDDKQRQPPLPGKIVYRDSIENRYLFPTDDPIDSTLEADLENLSQARYGQHVNSRRLTSSRNIFKSLRSLVSCLSAQSNHNSEHHSENTFRYFSQQATPSYNKQLGNKQSLPESQSQHEYCVRSISSSTQTTDSHRICDSCHQPVKADDRKVMLLNGAGEHLSNRQVSSSSDCGFSSASQNSINFQSFTGCSSTTRSLVIADDERRTNQIYQRIATRLMNTTELSSHDMARLKKVLFEGCSLDGDTCFTGNTTALNYLEADQIIADIIRKSHTAGKQQLATRCPEKCCSNITCSSTQNETQKSPEGPNESHYCCCDEQRAKAPSFTSEDSLGSANDYNHSMAELSSPAGGRAESQNGEKGANKCKLQRAFELKLTLSINSDKANQVPVMSSIEGDLHADDTLSPANSELLNSTLSINIAAPQQRESSSNPLINENVVASTVGE